MISREAECRQILKNEIFQRIFSEAELTMLGDYIERGNKKIGQIIQICQNSFSTEIFAQILRYALLQIISDEELPPLQNYLDQNQLHIDQRGGYVQLQQIDQIWRRGTNTILCNGNCQANAGPKNCQDPSQMAAAQDAPNVQAHPALSKSSQKKNPNIFFNFTDSRDASQSQIIPMQTAQQAMEDRIGQSDQSQSTQHVSQSQNFIQQNVILSKDQLMMEEDKIQQELNSIYRSYKKRIEDTKQTILLSQLSEIHLKSEILFEKQVFKSLFDILEFEVIKISQGQLEVISSIDSRHRTQLGDKSEMVQAYMDQLIENEFIFEQNFNKLHGLFTDLPESQKYVMKKKALNCYFLIAFHVLPNSELFSKIMLYEKQLTIAISRMASLIINLISEEMIYKQQFIQAKFIILEEYIRNIEFLLLESIKQKFEEMFNIKTKLFIDNLDSALNKGLSNMQKISIPETSVTINYQLDFYDSNNQFTKIKLFEKILTEIYYKFERSMILNLDRISQYRHYLRQQKIIFMHFNEDGLLEFTSSEFSAEMMKKHDLQLSAEQSFHFRDIFQNCEKILEMLTTLCEQPDNYYSCIHDDEEQPPEYHIVSQITKNKEFKGLFLYIKEEYPSELQEISLYKNKKMANSSMQESSLVTNTKQRLNQMATETNNKNYSKEKLMQDPELMGSYLIEYLPLKDQQKIDKKLQGADIDKKLQEIKKDIKPLNFRKSKIQQIVQTSKLERQQSSNYLKQMSTLRSVEKIQDRITPEELSVKPQSLEFLRSFDFHIFKLPDSEWLRISWTLLQQEDLVNKFNIPIKEYCSFIDRIKKFYQKRKNPFHNFFHALTVMHGCYMISCQTKVKKYLNDIQIFSLILGGLCHDVKHTARTNQFEINSQSKLALRYHDRSVLEQHHLAVTFKTLHKDEYNILKNVDKQSYLEIRKFMINNILATDIKEHFTNIKKFEMDFKDINLVQFNEQNILLLCGMITHTADFCGVIQKFELSKEWSMRVNQEFKAQYKEEGELGIPQTAYLKDLDRMDILAKSEIGFIKFIVRPLWINLNQFLQDDLKQCTDNLEENIKSWEKIYEEYVPKENVSAEKQKPAESSQKQSSEPDAKAQAPNGASETGPDNDRSKPTQEQSQQSADK